MMRNNPEFTQCNASGARYGEMSTPSETGSPNAGATAKQINRLKILKRAMYGLAGTELLRARMLPLHLPIQHAK
jgi:hypothetical protein